MSQKSLIYAFVSRGTVILAEYTEFSGNFNSIAFQCLQKLPATNNKFTYNCDGHTFNYLVDNGFSKSFSAFIFRSFLFSREILAKEEKRKMKWNEFLSLFLERLWISQMFRISKKTIVILIYKFVCFDVILVRSVFWHWYLNLSF